MSHSGGTALTSPTVQFTRGPCRGAAGTTIGAPFQIGRMLIFAVYAGFDDVATKCNPMTYHYDSSLWLITMTWFDDVTGLRLSTMAT